MDFFAFILLNAALFVRPAEISPALNGVPVFQILIALCLATSGPRLFNQWSNEPLTARPVTLCTLGFMAAIVMSHLARFDIGSAIFYGNNFLPVALYVALLVCILDTPTRLHRFMACLVLLITAMATLSMLHHFGYMTTLAPELQARRELGSNGEVLDEVVQLIGTGLFSDPNDLCLILSQGVIIGLYFASDRGAGLSRVLWLAPISVLGYAVYLTQSRGGLLALLAGIGVLVVGRLGLRRAVILGAVGLPILLTVLGGRFSKMSTDKDDTAHQRIELWRDSLIEFRSSPLFGIGTGNLSDRIGLVAHNSYVHGLAETGVFGDFFFLGIFYTSFRLIYGSGGVTTDPRLLRAKVFLLAGLASLAMSLYSLSRNYAISTYIIFGMAEVCSRLAPPDAPGAWRRFDARAVKEIFVLEVCFFVFITIFVRIFG